MKVNEVRIDNLVSYGDNICLVRSIYLTHFSCVNMDNGTDYGNSLQSNYKPIPLTEEWLLKFGFEIIPYENKEVYYSITDKVAMSYDDFIVIIIDSFDNKYFDYDYATCKIGYVHQLQNLYFALTGNELVKQ